MAMLNELLLVLEAEKEYKFNTDYINRTRTVATDQNRAPEVDDTPERKKPVTILAMPKDPKNRLGMALIFASFKQFKGFRQENLDHAQIVKGDNYVILYTNKNRSGDSVKMSLQNFAKLMHDQGMTTRVQGVDYDKATAKGREAKAKEDKLQDIIKKRADASTARDAARRAELNRYESFKERHAI